jgi:predicted RNase H-like nuclease (RuvC/YqgF family)
MSGQQEQKPETESEQLRSEICRLRKQIEGLKSWLWQVRKENQQLKERLESIDDCEALAAAMAFEADAALVARAAELKLATARRDEREVRRLEQSVCEARAIEEVAKAQLSLLRAELKKAQCRHDSEYNSD